MLVKNILIMIKYIFTMSENIVEYLESLELIDNFFLIIRRLDFQKKLYN
jgi:hypothetical protein